MKTINLSRDEFLNLQATGVNIKETQLKNDNLILIDNGNSPTAIFFTALQTNGIEIPDLMKNELFSDDEFALPSNYSVLKVDDRKVFYSFGLPVLVQDEKEIVDLTVYQLGNMGVFPDAMVGEELLAYIETVLDTNKLVNTPVNDLIKELLRDYSGSIVPCDFRIDVPAEEAKAFEKPPEENFKVVAELADKPESFYSLDSLSVVTDVTPLAILKFDSGDVCVFEKDEVLFRAPEENAFEFNEVIPSCGSGKVFIAVSNNGIEEMFLRESTYMKYQDHARPVIDYGEQLFHDEGTVSKLKQQKDESFEFTPAKYKKVKMDASVGFNTFFVNVRNKASMHDDFVVIDSEISTPLFVADPETDKLAISAFESYSNVDVDKLPTGEICVRPLVLADSLKDIDYDVSRRIKEIAEDRINRCLRLIGITERFDNVLDNFSLLKDLVGKTGKTKAFFTYLYNTMKAISFSIDVDENDRTVLWFDEKVHALDASFEEELNCGKLNPYTSPDVYKVLSNALASVGDTMKPVICSTEKPNRFIEAYRTDHENGKGSSGIYISRVFEI